MSRIGRQPINIPAGVEVSIDEKMVTAKGPKGELKVKILKKLKTQSLKSNLDCYVP
jgi:large subunit ribosomal protein L6